jgi:hypothetical protein
LVYCDIIILSKPRRIKMHKYIQARMTETEKIRAQKVALDLRIDDREFARLAILEKCDREESKKYERT